MATAYTPILKLALPVTGELQGLWGDVVNDNITSMIEQAVAGLATINSWTANSHTLTTANGTTSEARCAMLVIDDDGAGNPSGAATVICPTATKAYIVQNISGQTVTVKTSAGTSVAIPNNQSALVFCNGTNVVTGAFNGDVVGPASATDNTIVRYDGATGKLIQGSGVTIDDSNVVGGVTQLNVDNLRLDGNTLSSTSANGNVIIAPNGTGDVQVDADTLRVGDLNVNAIVTTNGTGDLTLSTNSGTNSGVITILDGVNGDINLTPNGTGEVNITKVNIDGGTINGTIGATTPSTGAFTTLSSTGNTTLGDAEADTVTINGTPTINAPTAIVTNSATNALRITQTGAGNALLVEDSASPDSTSLVIDADGVAVSGNVTRIPIGVANPRIQIHGVSATAQNNGFSAGAWANSAVQPYFSFTKSRGATVGDYTVVANADRLGTVGFYGADGTGLVLGALIQAEVDGTPGLNDMPGRLVFSTTADGASSPTERMRIDSAGQVTIGGSSVAGRTVRIAKNLTGATAVQGVQSAGTIQSDVTSNASMFSSTAATAAAAFTLSNLIHYEAFQSTIGASSSVTSQFGFNAGSSLTGATNNYGFYSNIASGTGRWNFYAAGSAANYFAGATQIANSLKAGRDATQYVEISGEAAGNYMTAVSVSGVPKNYFIRTDENSGGLYLSTGNAQNVFIQTNNTTRLTIGLDNIVSLNNNAGLQIARTAVTAPAASDGNVFSGTYTPTLTNVTNVSSSTAEALQYMRVGNVATVSGRVRVTPTAAGEVDIRISLPVASNFTAVNQLGGAGGSTVGVYNIPCALQGDVDSDVATLRFTATSSSERFMSFTFTYRVI